MSKECGKAKYGYTCVYPSGTLYSMPNKDKGLRIRVDQELREEFLATCHAEDKPASQVLREFMREYVRRDRQALQQDLFRSDGIEVDVPKSP